MPPAARRWAGVLEAVVVSLEKVHASTAAGKHGSAQMGEMAAKLAALRKRMKTANRVCICIVPVATFVFDRI